MIYDISSQTFSISDISSSPVPVYHPKYYLIIIIIIYYSFTVPKMYLLTPKMSYLLYHNFLTILYAF